MRFVTLGLCAVLLLLAGGRAWAATPATARPAALPTTTVPMQPWGRQFELRSAISGRSYRIYVHVPDAPAPARGYPAITFTDGNVAFPIATIAGITAEVEQRGKLLVVAVGYPLDDLKRLTIMRNRDLTPSQPPGAIQQYPGYPTMSAQDFGRSELFYRFLVEELRPVLAAMYRIDPQAQTLAGHSLGGMFVLNVLFRHPEAFQRYVAMSPAIWWNNRALLADEAAYTRAIVARKLAPRLLITAGEHEDDVPAVLPPGADRAAVSEEIRVNGIVVNARGLAERLASVAAPPAYDVRFRSIAGEHHNTSVPDAIVRAVAYALEPVAAQP